MSTAPGTTTTSASTCGLGWTDEPAEAPAGLGWPRTLDVQEPS